MKPRRKHDEAARRDHRHTLAVLAKVVVEIPAGVPLCRDFVLLTA